MNILLTNNKNAMTIITSNEFLVRKVGLGLNSKHKVVLINGVMRSGLANRLKVFSHKNIEM